MSCVILFIADRVAPAFRFCLDNSTLAQAIPIRYSFFLFFYLSHIIVTPTVFFREKVLSLTKSIVAENHITCMMITHNIPSALALGNRTIMMNDGKIVMELAGDTRKNMTTEDLLRAFHVESDRMLFSAE